MTLCLSKIDNSSVSRHTSISSPGSQLSSDGDIKESVVNHLPENVAGDASITHDPQVNGNGSHVSDKDVEGGVSDRLSHRLDSNGSCADNALVTNGQDSYPGTDSSGPPLKPSESMSMAILENPRHHTQNSEDSMDTLEMMEPLPEMSVQDAESVLGMSPSASQSVPSPSHYSSHFPSAGGQSSLDISEISNITSPAVGTPSNPPSYPPSYLSESTPTPYRSSSRSSIPPGYPSHYSGSAPMPYYEGQPDMHYGIGQSPYMPYPTSGSPFPPQIPGQRSLDYPSHYGSDPMMSQQAAMGLAPDVPPYPGSHGMPPEWLWQQHARMLSPLPPHLQSQSLQHRYLQQQSMLRQQQAMAAGMQQQQQLHQHQSAANFHSHGYPHSSSEAVKIHWQEQSRGTRTASHPPEHSEKNRASTKTLPRPEMTSQNKHYPSKDQTDSLKRKLPDWSNCVEGTRPYLARRRNLYSGDCGKFSLHVLKYRISGIIRGG